jgi:squalene-associated FAD-dependent desaturase
MGEPRVVVVGGGLAGLSAAVACMDAGARVTLLEARAHLGGATWSTRRRGLWIDNGQHVFLRCFTHYRAFLRRLGVEDRVHLQRRLSVPVLAPGGPTAWLRRNALPAPLHLAGSLLRFAHLPPAQRLRVALTARRLGRLRLENPELDERSFGSWLARQGESPVAIERFWDLLIRPTLNLPATDGSLALAARVFQTGLLESNHAGDIGHARVPLQRLHGDPARSLLEAGGARVELRARVSGIAATPGKGLVVGLRSGQIEADAVILATPHREAADLLPVDAGLDPAGLRRLGASPIVDLHVVFDRPVMELPFAAGIGTPLQWIFDRTESSGLERGQYLVVSLSAAGDYIGLSSELLRRLFTPELERLFPAARRARIEHFIVTRERSATFLQTPGARRHRPGSGTKLPGLYLAGAWIDTGWPATMESAVMSGLAAAREALIGAGRSRGLPAEAA